MVIKTGDIIRKDSSEKYSDSINPVIAKELKLRDKFVMWNFDKILIPLFANRNTGLQTNVLTNKNLFK